MNSKVKANAEISTGICAECSHYRSWYELSETKWVFKFYFLPLQNPLSVSRVTGDSPAFGITNSWRLLTHVMSHWDVLQDGLREQGAAKGWNDNFRGRGGAMLKDRLKLCRVVLAAWLGGAFDMEIWLEITCSFRFIIYLNGLLIQTQQ